MVKREREHEVAQSAQGLCTRVVCKYILKMSHFPLSANATQIIEYTPMN